MVDHSQPIIWSSDALADLSEIWDYYRKVAGPHTADRIVRDIHQACLLLEDHPSPGELEARSGRDYDPSPRAPTSSFTVSRMMRPRSSV
jgi:plasmid stabilization system protein ParE